MRTNRKHIAISALIAPALIAGLGIGLAPAASAAPNTCTATTCEVSAAADRAIRQAARAWAAHLKVTAEYNAAFAILEADFVNGSGDWETLYAASNLPTLEQALSSTYDVASADTNDALGFDSKDASAPWRGTHSALADIKNLIQELDGLFERMDALTKAGTQHASMWDSYLAIIEESQKLQDVADALSAEQKELLSSRGLDPILEQDASLWRAFYDAFPDYLATQSEFFASEDNVWALEVAARDARDRFLLAEEAYNDAYDTVTQGEADVDEWRQYLDEVTALANEDPTDENLAVVATTENELEGLIETLDSARSYLESMLAEKEIAETNYNTATLEAEEARSIHEEEFAYSIAAIASPEHEAIRDFQRTEEFSRVTETFSSPEYKTLSDKVTQAYNELFAMNNLASEQYAEIVAYEEQLGLTALHNESAEANKKLYAAIAAMLDVETVVPASEPIPTPVPMNAEVSRGTQGTSVVDATVLPAPIAPQPDSGRDDMTGANTKVVPLDGQTQDAVIGFSPIRINLKKITPAQRAAIANVPDGSVIEIKSSKKMTKRELARMVRSAKSLAVKFDGTVIVRNAPKAKAGVAIIRAPQ